MPKEFCWKDSGLRWLWVVPVLFGLDQWSKLAVMQNMALFESIPLLPFFSLTHVHNYGAAFSFLSDAGGWQRWFFTAIALGVSAMLLVWLRQCRKEQVVLSLAYSFILAGALGNLVDRLVHGYVIDFLDFYYQGWHWPAFNIADSAIFLGAALLIADWFMTGNTHER